MTAAEHGAQHECKRILPPVGGKKSGLLRPFIGYILLSNSCNFSWNGYMSL